MINTIKFFFIVFTILSFPVRGESEYTIYHLTHGILGEIVEASLDRFEMRNNNSIRSLDPSDEEWREKLALYHRVFMLLGKFTLSKVANDEKKDAIEFWTEKVNLFYYREPTFRQRFIDRIEDSFTRFDCILAFLLFLDEYNSKFNADDLLIDIILHKDFIKYLDLAKARKNLPLRQFAFQSAP